MNALSLITVLASCVDNADMAEIVANNNHADADGDGYLKLSYDEYKQLVGGTDENLPSDFNGFSDCDDENAAVNPGAEEDYTNEVDDDCNGIIDDSDGDSYTITNGGDCNDEDSAISPSTTEICDEIDNNCDGTIDEGLTTTYYIDDDGDGYGSPVIDAEACSAPESYVTDDTDCDDNDTTVYPAADEIVDGKDNDCDNSIDEGLSTTIAGDEGELAGSYVSYIGDLNDDGYDDFGVGTPGYTSDGKTDRGALQIFYGPIATDELSTLDADATLIGQNEGDSLGYYGFNTIGNFVPDYANTMIIGAPLHDYSTEEDVGAIYLATGDFAGNIELADEIDTADYHATKLTPEQPTASANDYFGVSTIGLGNVCDNDSHDDFIVGVLNSEITSLNPNSGSAYLFCSITDIKTLAYSLATGENSHLGVAAASGDFDDDGATDLAISANGANGSKGAVYIINNADIIDDDYIDVDVDASTTIGGVNQYDNIGDHLAAGDTNGDGNDDLLIGATSYSNNDGAAFLMLGQTINSNILNSDATFYDGDNAQELVGSDVELTDIDNNGTADIIIGAMNAEQSGAVYLFTNAQSGSISLSDAQDIFSTGEAGAYFGVSIDGRGDYNDDGFKDLLVGASGSNAGGTSSGAASLFFGGDF